MRKDIHPKTKTVVFVCASCKNKYEILSTLDQDNVNIDVCSGCHPFYLGKTSGAKISGKAEKLVDKFEAGKVQLTKKPEPKKTITKPRKSSKKALIDLVK